MAMWYRSQKVPQLWGEVVVVVCFNVLFLIICICGGWYVHMNTVFTEALDSLKLKLQLIVSPPAWVLGTEFRPFEAICTYLSSPLGWVFGQYTCLASRRYVWDRSPYVTH